MLIDATQHARVRVIGTFQVYGYRSVLELALGLGLWLVGLLGLGLCIPIG